MSDTLILTTEERREKWLRDLRELVLYLGANPEAINHYSQLRVVQWADDASDMADLAVSIGGRWDKEETDTHFRLIKSFGIHEVVIVTDREKVCERVQIGVETVEVPDPTVPLVSVTRPVYEWRCPDSLLALAEPRPSEVVPADDEIDPF